jgi:hypothetical protein
VTTNTIKRPSSRQRGRTGPPPSTPRWTFHKAVPPIRTARRAALDGRELFEDSYAINEEFREWLLMLEDHPELLQANVLMVPRDLHLGRRPETDGLLEI